MNERVKDQPLERISCEGSAAGEGLRTVKVLPWGETLSKKGKLVVDRESVSAICAAFEGHGVSLPIDLEHRSLDETAPPEHRQAVGWIERLWGEESKGVFALVRWSDRGRQYIRSGGFGYLSPVCILRKADRKVIELAEAALTNKPALPNMERLAASQGVLDTEVLTFAEGSRAMELLRELKTALGMEGEQTTEAVLAAALAKLKSAAGDASVAASVRSKLGLTSDAGVSEVALSMSLHAGGSTAVTELAAMREAESDRKADELLKRFVSAHTLNPHDKESMIAARSLAKENPERLELIMRNAKPYVTPGRTVAPTKEQCERGREIMQAMSAFSADHRNAQLTSMTAFVNVALRDKNLPKLSETEISQFSITL